jgi:hypothetical protein
MFRKITLFIVGMLTVAGVNAQCPTITCPGNISVSTDPNLCNAVVNYTAPVGQDQCYTTLTNVNFSYTGSVQTWTVPATVTEITVTLKGAGGGQGSYYGSLMGTPGIGGSAVAIVPVTPGQVINIYVGQKGSNSGYYSAGIGGWNGGANGGGAYYAGGGGGGATDIRIGGTALSNRRVVAAGGGGSGANGCGSENGGNGGGTTGGSGLYCGSAQTGYVGTGGTQSSGGTPGTYGWGVTNGTAGSGSTGYYYGGGGGGGGWYGGAGGAYSGGGGGSSYAVNTYTGIVLTSGGGNTNDGSAQISYILPTTTAQTSGLPSGATYPVGVTTNTFTATSPSAATSTCSFTVTVTDPNAPSFIVQPAVDTQRLCIGGSVTLTATASNTLSYRWYRNGVAVSNSGNVTGALTNTLTINNISAGQFGSYDLRATGTCADANSNPVVLSLSQPAAITTQPVTSQNICVGNAFTLTGAASSASGYQWYKNGSPLSNGGDISGATSPSLTIVNADATDIAAYTMTATGNSGCTSATSNAGNINVNPAVAVTAIPPPSISLCSGGPVQLDVVANSANGYQWYKNNSPLTNGGDISGANTGSLIVNNADASDAGSYHVVVLANPGCNNVTVVPTSVNINNSPVIVNQPQAIQNVCAGTNMIANVVASNGTSYQWYRNGIPLTNGGNITGAQGAILQVSNTTTANAGNYTVEIGPQSGCPPLMSNASAVTINPNASVITQPAPVVNLCEGNNIALTVTAGAAASYQWYKNGNALSNGLGVSGATTPTLTVANASTFGSGTYNVLMTAFYSGCASATSANSQVTVAPLASTLASTGTTQTVFQADGMAHTYVGNSCEPIAKVVDPFGGNTLGNTLAWVTVDPLVQTYNSQPYVQRHVDIEPTNNGLATVTIYATQQDFDAYNAWVVTNIGNNGPQLPVGGNTSGNNIRLMICHGTGTVPGNYTGLTDMNVVPSSVTWNGNWYEITVPVGGFSGFYIYTDVSLATKLSDIKAINEGTSNIVKWTTASEDAGCKFAIERSTDGRTFTQIGTVNGKGKPSAYSFTDAQAVTGINMYRVQMQEATGSNSYSAIVSATVNKGGAFGMNAYPNPVTDKVTVTLSEEAGANATIEVLDYTGKVLSTQPVSGSNTVVDMNNLPSGIYILKYMDGSNRQTLKINKQ